MAKSNGTTTLQNQLVDSLTISQANALRLILHSDASVNALRHALGLPRPPASRMELARQGRTIELFVGIRPLAEAE